MVLWVALADWVENDQLDRQQQRQRHEIRSSYRNGRWNLMQTLPLQGLLEGYPTLIQVGGDPAYHLPERR